MAADYNNLLTVLAQTTHVHAAQQALEAAYRYLAYELAKNPRLDPATWTRMWKAHRSMHWRDALVRHPLDTARQELVIAREHDLFLLRMFAEHNPTLTDEQKARMSARVPKLTDDQARLRLEIVLDSLKTVVPIGRAIPLSAGNRRLYAGINVASACALPTWKLQPHAEYLTSELASDQPGVWTTAITLIAGEYTSSFGDLVTTSRALGQDTRNVTLPAARPAARVAGATRDPHARQAGRS